VDASERGTFLRCRAEDATPTIERSAPTGAVGRMSGASTRIGDFMTRAVCTVTPETSIEALVALLLERGLSAVPVVDAEGQAVGIVTKTDLLRRYYDDAGTGEGAPRSVRTAEGVELDLGPGFHALATGDASVSDVMTERVLHLPEDANVGHAAAVMAFEGVHRIVVTGADGRIAGILSALDILRWLACETGFIVPEVGHVRGPRV
jgi:CBS domain-containing protein